MSRCAGTYLWNTVVTRIFQCEDDEHQESTSDELRKELASLGKERLRVCAEYSCSSFLRRWYCSKTTFKIVDCRDVVGVHYAASNEATEDLGYEVDWKSSPWELSEKTIAESDCGIEICSRVTSDIYAQHNTKAPADLPSVICDIS
jgi:hypothetical protein